MMYFGLYIIGVALAYGRVNAIFKSNIKGIKLSKFEQKIAQGQVNILAVFSWITFIIFFIDYLRIGRRSGR